MTDLRAGQDQFSETIVCDKLDPPLDVVQEALNIMVGKGDVQVVVSRDIDYTFDLTGLKIAMDSYINDAFLSDKDKALMEENNLSIKPRFTVKESIEGGMNVEMEVELGQKENSTLWLK